MNYREWKHKTLWQNKRLAKKMIFADAALTDPLETDQEIENEN